MSLPNAVLIYINKGKRALQQEKKEFANNGKQHFIPLPRCHLKADKMPC